ncbi:MAG: hypothetical protein IV105_06750 [Rhizobacter sp.]|nr:hypothetical protein [Rhizobacter sp.]
MKRTLIALAAVTLAAGANAGEVYTGIGTHGVMLGFAQALSPQFTVRGDFGTLGSRDKNEREEGIDYEGKATYNRVGLFGDWFPFDGGGFRFTGGVTFNNMKLDLLARGNGTPMTIGNNTYTTDSTDRFNVKIEFPKTTPYLGLGYGHQLSTGWGFVFDLGASIGKAKVTESHSGNNFSLIPQSDIDAELAEIRDGAGKIKAIPMIAIGFNYRF